MNPDQGDLLKHMVSGVIYKVVSVTLLIDTSEMYLWKGFLQNTTTGETIPYYLASADYWEKFWEITQSLPKKWEVGKIYRSTKSGYLWMVINNLNHGILEVSRVNPITLKAHGYTSNMTVSFANKYLIPFTTENEEKTQTQEMELFT